MKLFGYNQDFEGICNGYTWMWIQSQLLDPAESEQFYKRLKIIEAYQNDIGKLKGTIDEIKKTIISLTGQSELKKQLHTEHQELLEILSFCEGIELYHNPERHKELFTTNETESDNKHRSDPKTSTTKMYFQQNNVQLISPITASDKLLEINRNRGNHSPMNVLINDCFILTPEECTSYFKDLQSWFDEHSKQFGHQTVIPIKLGTDNHAIACTYNLKLKKWQFMDINDSDEQEYVRDIQNIDDLTNNIQLAFSDDIYLLFNAMPIVMDPSTISTDALSELKQLNQNHQNLSKERSLRVNSRNASIQYIASKNGDLEVIKKLVALGADVNVTKINGSSPLCIACQTKEFKVAQFLVTNGATVNHTKNNGATPLFLAVQAGDVDIVNLLLENKAQVNQQGDQGITPLLAACSEDNVTMVQVLLSHGADPNLANRNGVTPLDFAFKYKNTELIKLLISNGACIDQHLINGFSPLINAIISGDYELINYLLNNRANPDHQDQDGVTPIYWACMLGNDLAVRLLLEHKARSINCICETGHTPLLVSCLSEYTRRNQNLFRLLLDSGGDINAKNDDGESCLEIALKSNNSAAIKVLLAYFQKHSLKYEEFLSIKSRSSQDILSYLVQINNSNENEEIKNSSGFFNNNSSQANQTQFPTAELMKHL
ncbi:ankyrin repeat domain-containing protein [Legionella quateirensis]|nr:ankyrin repeat domain-containing protein [Legionella quateirensis]